MTRKRSEIDSGDAQAPVPDGNLPHDPRVSEMSPSATDRHGSEAPRDPLDRKATGANVLKLGVGCLAIVAVLALLGWLLS